MHQSISMVSCIWSHTHMYEQKYHLFIYTASACVCVVSAIINAMIESIVYEEKTTLHFVNLKKVTERILSIS